MPSLKELEDAAFAGQVATDIASEVLADSSSEDDMNTGLKTPEDFLRLIDQVDAEHDESFKRFCAVCRRDF